MTNLERQLETLARQQAVIAELGYRANKNDDVDSLLDEISNLVAQILDVDFTHILELQTDSDSLLLRAGVGWPEQMIGTFSFKAEPILHFALNVGIVENAKFDARAASWPLLIQNQITSGAWVIIQGQDRPFGVLGVFTRQRRPFNQGDIYFLSAVANIIATRLEREYTLAKMNQRHRELLTLELAGAAITSSLDLQEVLHTVAKGMAQLFGVPGCAIWRWEAASQSLELMLDYRLDMWLTEAPAEIQAICYHFEDYPLAHDVLVRHTSVQLTLEQPDLSPERQQFMQAEQVQSLLVLPMLSRNCAVGLVEIYDDWSIRRFTDEEIALAQLQANQAAVAIENAQLYKQVQRHALELEQRVQERTAELQKINTELQAEIAERKQIEEKLRVARDKALAASRIKMELLARVSHELRTPLNGILGYAELLEMEVFGPISERQRQTISKIVDSTQRQTGIINEMLDQARLDSGRLEVEFSTFAPQEILDDVQLQMQPLADIKGLSFSTAIAENLPEVLENDPNRLRQLLTHLVGNALKFTEQGGVRIEIFRLNANYWGIKVIDTGPGIPLEAQGYIFEPFRQVDGSVTRRYGGTGLGLSIVKQLAELMGGEVGVQSQLGQGTTFIVTLPFQPNRSSPNH